MSIETILEKIYARKILRVVAHLIFWIVVMLVSLYSTLISFNAFNHFGMGALWLLSLTGTMNLALFYYLFVYNIIPVFIKRRYVTGLLATAGLLILYTYISTLTEKLILLKCTECIEQLRVTSHDYYEFLQRQWSARLIAKLASLGTLINLVFNICVPVTIKIAIQSFRQQLAAVRLAKENVELEFNFLKSQVNPHFLFNSLNNIYGLILKNENEKAAGTVARLAEFMRYTLYNSNQDKVPLQKEIQLLRDYIELEKIRLNYTQVLFNIKIDEGNYEIPSLLLVPLIENTFKFSEDLPGACICISLVVERGRLNVTIDNAVDVNRQLSQTGGIGLQNLKKRLNLYYLHKHQYQVITTEKDYTASITIEL
jgi:hypothetical protein